MNLVEVWFGIIERLSAVDHSPVLDLMTKIREFITGWNHRKHPFIWTKPARPGPRRSSENVKMSQLRATGLSGAACTSFRVAMRSHIVSNG